MCPWLLWVTTTWSIMSRPNMCSILVLVAIYVSMAAVGYYNLGHQVNTKYVLFSSSGGYIQYVPMAAVGYYNLGHQVNTKYVLFSSSGGYICAHGCCGLLQPGSSSQDQHCGFCLQWNGK
jgi:hypothetical protein